MAGGGDEQYAPPAMTVPNGNPIAETMNSMAAMPPADPFQGMPVGDASMGMAAGGGIPEVTKLREWEAKHEEELEETARKEASAKAQTRESAATELAKFYQDRKAEMTKRVEVNREQEKDMEAGRLAAMKPDANP